MSRRGWAAPLVVVGFLAVSAGAAVYYLAPVESTYRATTEPAGGPADTRTDVGEVDHLVFDGRLYLRTETRRRLALLGTRSSTHAWDPPALARFRQAHPDLAADEAFWPDPGAADGGVAWLAPR